MQSYCEAREVLVDEANDLIEGDLLRRLDGTFCDVLKQV
jgi:hypothetical protein